MPDVDRTKAIQGLRELADFLDANPGASLPWNGTICWHYTCTPDEMQRLVKEYGGKWEKGGDENFFRLTRRFGGLEYQIYGSREAVCTAVKVGERLVTKEVAVDEDAEWKLKAELETLPKHPVTITEDIVEWQCPSLLGAS